MTTVCQAYTSTGEAERAIERLVAAGVPESRIQLIMGQAARDAREAPSGTFAGTLAAGGALAGRPDRQRIGSFGDADRDTVTTYRAGARRTRIASHHRLERLLVEAGLDRASARTNVDALHAGRVLVLVEDARATRLRAA
jgi:hypothetical protein